jgi:hypothetical protein
MGVVVKVLRAALTRPSPVKAPGFVVDRSSLRSTSKARRRLLREHVPNRTRAPLRAPRRFLPRKNAEETEVERGLRRLAAAVILWSGTQGHGRRTPRTRSASFDSKVFNSLTERPQG